MKRILAAFFAMLLLVGIFSSCRSHQTCPAYKNGSAQAASTYHSDKA
ncbi:MAG: hypothetical protein JXR53_07135 [Bacteroidales bacterium]|nr:hypothetical protein [Bacteroidales bacterium]